MTRPQAQELLTREQADPRALLAHIRKPNRTRERPQGRSQDEVRISKRAARHARPYIFGMDE